MPQFNPPHPGETLLEDVLPALNMSITAMARHLKLSHKTLARILHGHSRISPDLAVRLERAGISTARLWLAIQASYDIWQAEHRPQPPIERFASMS